MEHEDVAVKYGTLSDKNLGDDITPPSPKDDISPRRTVKWAKLEEHAFQSVGPIRRSYGVRINWTNGKVRIMWVAGVAIPVAGRFPKGIRGVAPLLRKQPWLGAPGPSQAPGFFLIKTAKRPPTRRAGCPEPRLNLV